MEGELAVVRNVNTLLLHQLDEADSYSRRSCMIVMGNNHKPQQTTTDDHKRPANNHKRSQMTINHQQMTTNHQHMTTNYKQTNTNYQKTTINQTKNLMFHFFFPYPVITKNTPFHSLQCQISGGFQIV